MSINIQINDDYRLSSDKYQWIIQKKKMRKDKKTGEKYQDWEGISFHPTPTKAVQSISQMLIRTSEAETLTEALERVDSVVTTLTQALTPYFDVKLTDRDDNKHSWTE